MPVRGLKENTSLIRTENQLKTGKTGFSESFMAVSFIDSILRKSPEEFTRETALALLELLRSKRFENKKQAYFLYRKATEVLIHIATNKTHPLSGYNVSNLQEILISSNGKKHRAVSEGLGSLPITIRGPVLPELNTGSVHGLEFNELIALMGNPDSDKIEWHGRMLRFPLQSGKTGCIKFATTKENILHITAEAFWLDYLRENPPCSEISFEVPEPVCIKDHFTFCLNRLPGLVEGNSRIYQPATVIAFIADKTYFHYPNDPGITERCQDSAEKIFIKNAALLGSLTARGLVHTALIPLFHNRVQQSRRQDGGLYLWEMGGRLDRWLESSLYPNFAVSGIRDFEHLISVNNSRDIRHYIGEHILGFILVMGSCFRNLAPEIAGTDIDGKPVDTRHLFDQNQFARLIEVTVKTYYQSITGTALENLDRFFPKSMIEELVDAMGVDRHMEEVLRIPDQENMDDNAFEAFLISRGKTKSFTEKTTRGEDDIVLTTGPHLGGFNQPISAPALLDFLFCISSLCVSDRYLMENGLNEYAN